MSHEEARGRLPVATQPKGRKELWQEIWFHSGMMRGFLSTDSVMSRGTRPSVTVIKFEAKGQSHSVPSQRRTARFPELQGTSRRGGGGEVRLGAEEASLKHPVRYQ